MGFVISLQFSWTPKFISSDLVLAPRTQPTRPRQLAIFRNPGSLLVFGAHWNDCSAEALRLRLHLPGAECRLVRS